MSESSYLSDCSDCIESVLCSFDMETGQTIDDTVAIKIIRLLLDKYHFKDDILKFDDDLIERGFNFVDKAMQKGLSGVPVEKIVKVLGVVRFVAERRSEGGREYLRAINRFVGPRG